MVKEKPHVVSSGSTTLLELGTERLERLCEALEFSTRRSEIVGLFGRLAESWGGHPVGAPMAWNSHVVDDGTPFEFSAAYGDAVELRLLVEPLGKVPSLESNAKAAHDLLVELSSEYDISLERFEKVRDLFLPSRPRGPFSLWVAAGFRGTRPPDFKLYLCPGARGARWAPAVLEEALVRLGFDRAWGLVGRHMCARGPEVDEFTYFSLDLGRTPEARVKVYARHQAATPADFEIIASGCPSHRPGELQRFLTAAAPQCAHFDNRPPSTCYAFVEGKDDTPIAVTTHFPINGYAAHDEEAAEAVLACHELFGISPTAYRRTLEAIATRPLDRDVGLQSYVSFRRHADRPRLTVYLPCEAFRPGQVAPSGAATKPSGVCEIVDRYEHDGDITAHPFVRRLSREPFDRGRVWLLLANLFLNEEGRARWLAQLAARVGSDSVRSAIVSVLNDELGRGTFEHAPIRSFSQLMKRIESWRPAAQPDWQLAPGRRLDARLHAIGRQPDVHVTIGALLAGEVFRRQVAAFLEEQVGRDETPRETALPWRRSSDAAPDAVQALANVVPAESLSALWEGATQRRRVEWAFFDELYDACYRNAPRENSRKFA